MVSTRAALARAGRVYDANVRGRARAARRASIRRRRDRARARVRRLACALGARAAGRVVDVAARLASRGARARAGGRSEWRDIRRGCAARLGADPRFGTTGVSAPPVSTYRFQLNAEFGFDEVRALLSYVR